MRELIGTTLHAERQTYLAARKAGDVEGAWRALERSHILAQPFLVPHIRVHLTMLGLALRGADLREVRGQLLRLFLAPIGNLIGRLPVGNTGRSDVSAFVAMPMPAEIEAVLADRTVEERHG